jgi:hypothetical protein
MLKNCKACGKEIGKSVKKCPECGTDQRNFFGKHKIITGILVIVVLIVVVSALNKGGSTTTTDQTNKPTITKAEFEQLKSGMTYEEATAIIGGPGEVISESGNKGEALYTVMYQYKGEGDLGANANMMFQGNKLQNKAQMGLK